MSFGRGMMVTVAVTVGRPSVFTGLWRLGTVFASAGQMRKLATNAIGGKPVGRGRWRTDEDETGDEGLSATGTDIH